MRGLFLYPFSIFPMIQAATAGCFFHTPGKAQTGLDRDGFRSQVEGFGRSQASKATWETKRAEAIANKLFSLGTTNENVHAYLKDKTVIDMLSEHSIKYIQRIS